MDANEGGSKEQPEVLPLAKVDPKLFELLKQKADEDSKVRQEISELCDNLEQTISYAQGILSRIHSASRAEFPAIVTQVEDAVKQEVNAVLKLASFSSTYSYYKYASRWTRMVQEAVLSTLMCAWLGGMGNASRPGQLGRLLSIEDVGEILQVPVNLKGRDAFHITLEEYLHALTSLTEELARLAVNTVTHGDNALAVGIATFVKQMHTDFQLLNLKNDMLRKRVDGIKYNVKKVEDVVYDLSLRNLIPGRAGT